MAGVAHHYNAEKHRFAVALPGGQRTALLKPSNLLWRGRAVENKADKGETGAQSPTKVLAGYNPSHHSQTPTPDTPLHHHSPPRL